MRLSLIFLVSLLFISNNCFAQADTSSQEGYDTVFVKESPVVIDLGRHRVVEDRYSKLYVSAFFPMSYDFNWYRRVNGYEYYLDKIRKANSVNYTRGLGIGMYYLPLKRGTRVWNLNAFYTRYYEEFWYSPRQRNTNMFDFVGMDLKRGIWIRRDKKFFSMIVMVGYGIQFKIAEKGITYGLDEEHDVWQSLKSVKRYRTVQNYASFSIKMVFRMNRFKLGVEPYFFCHLRNFTTDYQPYKQVLMQAGLRTSLILCY